MSRDDALILDIVLAAEDARNFVQGMSFADFEASRLHQNAVVRSLEVIGEAAGKLSNDFTTAHQGIEWRKIANMRHSLIHAYIEVRLDIVWAVTQNDLPHWSRRLNP
jgi:uncharacterized protein with HEPN domain